MVITMKIAGGTPSFPRKRESICLTLSVHQPKREASTTQSSKRSDVREHNGKTIAVERSRFLAALEMTRSPQGLRLCIH